MNDPNITMEEYIRLEEEKARRHGQTFNWQTATFGNVKNYKDEDDCSIDFETEFSAIVLDNTLTTIPSEPTVCPSNENNVDFRILLEESDDEDYTENDNMPSSPNSTVDYLDDLDYFKDFKNEFPAIVYNDGLTSKSDLEYNPLISSERIDKFNLIDEASLSEYDEKIVSRFNDLFNIIHPDESKSEKDNDDNDISIIQSPEDNEITHGKNGLSKISHDKTIRTFETGSFIIEVNIVIWEYCVNRMLFFLIIILYVPFGIPFDPKRYYKDGSHTNVVEAKVHMAPLPAADQRHPWLRYQIQEYTEEIRRNKAGFGCKIEDGVFWKGAASVREMSDTEMGLDVVDTMCFQLGGVRRRMTDRLIPDKGDLRDYWIEISSDRDFLGPAPSYVLIRDHVRRLCHRMIAYSIFGKGQAPEKVTGVDLFYLRSMDRGTTNVPHPLAYYLFRHEKGRKSGARMSGGHFIRRLAMHFGLVSNEGLRGLQGPERQQAAAAGAYKEDEARPTAEKGAQEIAVPVPAPTQAPPPAPYHQTMSHRIERVEEEVHDLRRDVVGLRGVVESFSMEQSRVSTWLITCMTQLMDASGQTYQPLYSTHVGSSRLSFQRRVRPRTGDASTFAALHTDSTPDP
ncbi:hypothetical protein Tco_0449952 [Tanacetum coccineum]